jgi:uncharacterized membrane protein YukC
MSEKEAPKPGKSDGATSSEEIREEIEETREELGDTVAAVAEKTDVKKQAKAKVGGAKAEGVRQVQSFAKRNPAPAAIGALVGLLALWRLLRR